MAEENRFAHLLAPIRDLSANWHTDIAAELSDYLAQLEDITFSFDGGNTALNFAEGARRCGGARARRAAEPAEQSPDFEIRVAARRSRAADPGLDVRVLAQGGVPAQAGVQRAGGGGQQTARQAPFAFVPGAVASCTLLLTRAAPPRAGAPRWMAARATRASLTRTRMTWPRSWAWTTCSKVCPAVRALFCHGD